MSMCTPLVESSDSRGSVADDEAELLGQLEPCNVPDCRSRLTLKWVFFFGLLPICGRLIKFSIIHVLRSCASSILTPASFMSFLMTSLHLSFGLPIFRCPPTSIFHVLITTSSSVFISTCPNHLSLTSQMLLCAPLWQPNLDWSIKVLIFSKLGRIDHHQSAQDIL